MVHTVAVGQLGAVGIRPYYQGWLNRKNTHVWPKGPNVADSGTLKMAAYSAVMAEGQPTLRYEEEQSQGSNRRTM